MLGIFTCPENSRNESKFHSACKDKRGNLETVKLLFERSKEIGLDLIKPNNHGWTAFHYACQIGNMEIVNFMVDHAEELVLNGLTTNDENGLHFACDNGNLDVVKLLSDHPETGIDINQRDADGNTPMYNACYSHNVDLVQFLFEHAEEKGIDLLAENNEGETILHASIDSDGSLEMTKLILLHADQIGLDVNHEDLEGDTALDFEELDRWQEIVTCLENYI